ncbi:hypothetical protein M8818_003575 [Zalaria obscura]|uniref:Uncharacterized protein n=1 Tax=Zalaria obscura TaxID=2024903 RepID=A0ACC3SJ28_9PEZI
MDLGVLRNTRSGAIPSYHRLLMAPVCAILLPSVSLPEAPSVHHVSRKNQWIYSRRDRHPYYKGWRRERGSSLLALSPEVLPRRLLHLFWRASGPPCSLRQPGTSGEQSISCDHDFQFHIPARRKTTLLGTLKVLVIGYIVNMAAGLFVAGFFCWWADTLETDVQKSYAVKQAEGRVNVQWSVNLLRGIGCNWFVSLAAFLAASCNDHVSKIYSIWIPIWAFVMMSYQHCIANFYMVPIGMFYGTNFGVGKFIYQSVIPVTIGNVIGGVIPAGLSFWFLYGKNSPIGLDSGKELGKERGAEVEEQQVANPSAAGNTSQMAGPPGYMV